VFRPERWLSEDARGKEKYLLHFGQGHRKCIGQNQALLTLWKGSVAILQRYRISAVNVHGQERTPSELRLNARGFAEPWEAVMVKLSRRGKE
jgi:cytochrome P450